jgi:hypothetical protein
MNFHGEPEFLFDAHQAGALQTFHVEQLKQVSRTESRHER